MFFESKPFAKNKYGMVRMNAAAVHLQSWDFISILLASTWHCFRHLIKGLGEFSLGSVYSGK